MLTIGGDDFHRLCDAIDAIHAGLERENAELRQRVAALDNERGNMHDGWVLLPLDADGETIHIGDVMKNIVCPSVHREVTGVGAECFYGWDDGNGRYSQFDVNCYRHYHAPTVEDVLTKFGIDWEYEDNCEDRAALLAEYASKLRLAGDAE